MSLSGQLIDLIENKSIGSEDLETASQYFLGNVTELNQNGVEIRAEFAKTE